MKNSNKKTLCYMYIMMIATMIFYFGVILLASIFIPEGIQQLVIIIISTLILFVVCLVALKIEFEIGYYECKNCKHAFDSTYKEIVWAMHIGTTRYLKCPKCKKKSWSKNVFTNQ